MLFSGQVYTMELQFLLADVPGFIPMSEGKRVRGAVQVYGTQARDQIYSIGLRFFNEMGISNFLDDVFCCVDELIKNAVKANYKLLLIMETMYCLNSRMNP